MRLAPKRGVEAHVDVVVVIRQRHGVAAEIEQGDDLVRPHRALEAHQQAHRLLGDPAALLVPEDRDAVDLGDVHRVPRGVLGDVARRGEVAVARLEARHRGLEARVGEVLERGKHAPVDRAGADVLPAAGIDLDPLVVEHPALEQRLGHHQDLADRQVVAVAQGVLAVGAVDGRGLEQLPAVEDRLGVDPRSAAACGPDLEVEVRGLAGDGAVDAAEDGPADHVRADLEPAQADVPGVEAIGAREVVLEGGHAALATELRVE